MWQTPCILLGCTGKCLSCNVKEMIKMGERIADLASLIQCISDKRINWTAYLLQLAFGWILTGEKIKRLERKYKGMSHSRDSQSFWFPIIFQRGWHKLFLICSKQVRAREAALVNSPMWIKSLLLHLSVFVYWQDVMWQDFFSPLNACTQAQLFCFWSNFWVFHWVFETSHPHIHLSTSLTISRGEGGLYNFVYKYLAFNTVVYGLKVARYLTVLYVVVKFA